MPGKRRRKAPPKPQPPDAEPAAVVSQIGTDSLVNAAVLAVDSQEALAAPAARPVRAPSKTQSEAGPAGDGKLDDSHTWSLTSLDSGSESDLPEASSLLRTPVMPKQTTQTRSEPKGGSKKRKRQRVLAKSASEIPRATGEGEPDSGNECNSLRVPGELIMAYHLRKYYPARIVSQPKQDRYAIEFFDGARATIIRRRFYTQYEPEFSTCTMGEMRLIGDEPAKRFTTESDVDIDPERDFKHECKLYPRLVAEMEKIRHHLDALHNCPADGVAEMAATEDRMAVFFGNDSSAKRMLSHRVYPAFLNRGEFDFAGRILWRWYAMPPRAIHPNAEASSSAPTNGASDSGEPEPHIDSGGDSPDGSSVDVVGALGPGPPHTVEAACSQTALSDMADLSASALAINFIHDVLLPHAIKRMIAERDGCSLSDAEECMRKVNEVNWVDQILAARKANVT